MASHPTCALVRTRDTVAVRVRPNQLAELDPKHVITYSFSLKRPWLSQHVDYGLPACSHACGVASLAVQGHPRLCRHC
jgi:hypothetical protein